MKKINSLWFIGIDDTDNVDSRGTGFIARSLAKHLTDQGFGKSDGITRHQLLVSPDIPYTSHNSSLCIHWKADHLDLSNLISICKEFLSNNSASGSDPGLCIIQSASIPDALITFGQDCKKIIKTKKEAYMLANQFSFHLSEHGGTGSGVIGALAGVGLSASGNDGRYVSLKGIREMNGRCTITEIFEKTSISSIRTLDGLLPDPTDIVDVGDWFRPVFVDHQPTLFIKKSEDLSVKWKIIDKEIIKQNY